MVTDVEQRVAILEAQFARHGPEHHNQGRDPIPGYPQTKPTSGAPTHEAPEGTLCEVIPDNEYYFNSDGSTGWTLFASGGVGAPKGALYLALALNADLTAERVMSAGQGLSENDTGPNGTYVLRTADGQIIHSALSGGSDTDSHHAKFTDSDARSAVPYVTTVTFGWDPQSPQVFTP
jgi:hypothetical protein